jgi:hypothetical protein
MTIQLYVRHLILCRQIYRPFRAKFHLRNDRMMPTHRSPQAVRVRFFRQPNKILTNYNAYHEYTVPAVHNDTRASLPPPSCCNVQHQSLTG